MKDHYKNRLYLIVKLIFFGVIIVLYGCDIGGMINGFAGREDVFYNSVQIGKPLTFEVDDAGIAYYICIGRKDGPRHKLKAIISDPDGTMIASIVDSGDRRIREMEFVSDKTGPHQLIINWNFSGATGVGYVTVDIQKEVKKEER